MAFVFALLASIIIGLFAGLFAALKIARMFAHECCNQQPAPVPNRLKLIGGRFMLTFPETRPPDVIHFTPAVVVDAEGGVLDDQPKLNYTFASSDPSIVSFEQLNASDPFEITVTYNTAKKAPDGSFSFSTLKATSDPITLSDGSTAVDIVTEDIQLVIGPAAGFQKSSFNFPTV